MEIKLWNPDWVEAPFEVSFLFGVCVPYSVCSWSRKRRRKWLRQEIRRVTRMAEAPIKWTREVC